MRSSTPGHRSSRCRSRDREVTYKVQVWDWISVRHGGHAITFRVSWLLAGRRRHRTFRSHELARSFQDLLALTNREGLPFDVRTGMPVSVPALTAQRSSRSGQRSSTGRPHD